MASPMPRHLMPSVLPPGVERGPLGRRLVAHLIDSLVPAIALWLIARSGDGRGGTVTTVVGVVVIGAWLGLVWWMYAVRAAGPGMRLMKLQLVGLADGRPIGWMRFLVRALVLAALEATVVGALVMVIFLVTQRRWQGWHDLVANSVVIKERMLAPPQPKPAPQPAAQPVPPQPAAVPAGGRDGQIQEAAPTPATAPAVVGDGQIEEATRTPATCDGWVAVLDDGRELPIGGLVVLGRNPEGGPREEGVQLVQIADETRTVSKTHLALGVDGRGAFVIDRGSTNGSIVTDADGASRPCVPGVRTPVGDGTIVSFGDHWLEVQRRPVPVVSAHAPVGS